MSATNGETAMTEKITTERETLERETMELVAVIGRLKREAIAMHLGENWNQRATQPVEMSSEDAFTVWVEEESANFPTLDREHLRNSLRNAWIAGYNACVDAAMQCPMPCP